MQSRLFQVVQLVIYYFPVNSKLPVAVNKWRQALMLGKRNTVRGGVGKILARENVMAYLLIVWRVPHNVPNNFKNQLQHFF